LTYFGPAQPFLVASTASPSTPTLATRLRGLAACTAQLP
jgi:hypothetical protein